MVVNKFSYDGTFATVEFSFGSSQRLENTPAIQFMDAIHGGRTTDSALDYRIITDYGIHTTTFEDISPTEVTFLGENAFKFTFSFTFSSSTYVSHEMALDTRKQERREQEAKDQEMLDQMEEMIVHHKNRNFEVVKPEPPPERIISETSEGEPYNETPVGYSIYKGGKVS